jgi:enamine deaminase RidA (YjgF/YER057c/UK114 family)
MAENSQPNQPLPTAKTDQTTAFRVPQKASMGRDEMAGEVTMQTMSRQLITSGSPFEATVGFSRAVRVANLVAVSGTAPIWPDETVDPDPYVQTRRCLEIIEAALIEAGTGLAAVVRTRAFISEFGVWEAVGRAHADVFGEIRPASTMVVVTGFLDRRWKVEIEADAVID